MRQADGTEPLARARELCRTSTEAEKLLWNRLRDRRLEGFKFRRQVWVDSFVADFLCRETKLIVEVDGARSKALGEAGFRVIRFRNNEVRNDIEAVLEQRRAELLKGVPSPSRALRPGPLPLPGGERE
jgi:very-short-patch-repair endonuclease